MERFSEIDAMNFNTRTEGGGVVINSNLDFAVDMANQEANIFRASAIIVRGVTCGHPFEDGNKRTTAYLLLTAMGEDKYMCDISKLLSGLLLVAKNQIVDLKILERRIRRWFIKR